MENKTQEQGQEWTVATLKEYIEKILVEKDKAINIALQAAEKSVLVAETNSEKWRNSANEWRGAMTDREKNFLTRSEFISYKESAEKLQSIEKTRADKVEGRGLGTTAFFGYIVLGAGLILTILNITNIIK